MGGRFTDDYKNIVNIVKMFFVDPSRIMIVLTKAGGMSNKSKTTKLEAWTKELR
jgi:hypothetical protein